MKRMIMSMLSMSLLFGFTTPIMAEENTTYKVEYNDENSMNSIFKEVFEENIGNMKYKSKTSNVMTYESKNYQIDVKGLNVKKEGTQNISMKLSDKTTTKIASVLTKVNKEATVEVTDSEAPVFSGSTNLETTVGTELNVNDLVKAEDAKDGQVNVSITGDVDYNKIGTYTLTATAQDKSGNESSEAITVNVKEDTFYSTIAEAAKAQVGVNQDCTMLVTNSLAAVGINFHGAPAAYMSLGTVTNDPVPGDICVYNGHVAIYIGNGQAVHGGWLGYTTVISTVECTNAFVAYIHVNKV